MHVCRSSGGRSGDEAEAARLILVWVDHEVALVHVPELLEGRLEFISSVRNAEKQKSVRHRSVKV